MSKLYDISWYGKYTKCDKKVKYTLCFLETCLLTLLVAWAWKVRVLFGFKIAELKELRFMRSVKPLKVKNFHFLAIWLDGQCLWTWLDTVLRRKPFKCLNKGKRSKKWGFLCAFSMDDALMAALFQDFTDKLKRIYSNNSKFQNCNYISMVFPQIKPLFLRKQKKMQLK